MSVTIPFFRLVCRCGQVLTGRRTARPQWLVCARCGQKLLAYPAEPIAKPAPFDRPTRWLLLGLGLALGTLLVVLQLRGLPSPPACDPLDPSWEQTLADAQIHLARGRFHRAVQLLEQIPPHQLGDAQRRSWQQWHRQAALAADLTDLSLQEMVQLAALQRDPVEWQAQWQRHRGRGIILDGVVQRTARNQLELIGFAPLWRDEPILLALDDLQLLSFLPLDRPQRLIFGWRLDRIERTASGWVVRPMPQSAVLFTDAATLQALSPVELGEDLPEVLQRQADWLATLGL